MEHKERAVDEVKKITPDAESYNILNVHPDFMGGTLYVVGFKNSEGVFHNYVFICGQEIFLAKNEALLLSWVSKKAKRLNILEQLGGVSGIIGLIITLAIVILVIARPGSEVPRELWAALTAVLAFYFGSKASKQ